jgi:hypothetical protein
MIFRGFQGVAPWTGITRGFQGVAPWTGTYPPTEEGS